MTTGIVVLFISHILLISISRSWYFDSFSVTLTEVFRMVWPYLWGCIPLLFCFWWQCLVYQLWSLCRSVWVCPIGWSRYFQRLCPADVRTTCSLSWSYILCRFCSADRLLFYSAVECTTSWLVRNSLRRCVRWFSTDPTFWVCAIFDDAMVIGPRCQTLVLCIYHQAFCLSFQSMVEAFFGLHFIYVCVFGSLRILPMHWLLTPGLIASVAGLVVCFDFYSTGVLGCCYIFCWWYFWEVQPLIEFSSLLLIDKRFFLSSWCSTNWRSGSSVDVR